MAESVIIDGRYELTELLGTGVSGEVWAAKQRSVDRSVAVKLLKHMDDDRFAIRFVNEARAIAMLNHPNIVTLFDYGFDTGVGTHFMVMEHVEGQLLADALFEAMPVQERVMVVRDIASALRDAHGAGILHRDLKPENVILAAGYEGARTVKVLDFGLARIRGLEEIVISTGLSQETTTTRITQKGEIQGTPAYMSPEQAIGSLEIGPPTDIYALGVMLYELLHGHVPFEHRDAWEVIYSQVRDTPAISDSVPELLGELIMLMMAKEASERPVADDVVQMLGRYLEVENQLPVSAVEDAMIYGDGFVLEESEEEARRWWLVIPFLALLFLVVGVWWVANRSNEELPRRMEPQERIVIKEVPVEVEVIKEVPAPAALAEAAHGDHMHELPTPVPSEVVPAPSPGDSVSQDVDRNPQRESGKRSPKDDSFEEIKLSL